MNGLASIRQSLPLRQGLNLSEIAAQGQAAQATARQNLAIGATGGPTPIIYTTEGRVSAKPHAVIEYDGYVYIFHRGDIAACKMNPSDFNDVTYFDASALGQICDPLDGSGFLYGIDETTTAIKKFNTANLTISNLVASTFAFAGGPSICSDGAGNLYICGPVSAANSEVRKYRISDGALLNTRLLAGFRSAHAINYLGGALWVSGIYSTAANGWFAKLSPADLSDIIAPADFAPGGGETLGPTDDFTWDGTYVYFVSENPPVANAQFARVHQISGAVTYYDLPGGVLGKSWAALWDGGTKVYIPQAERLGIITLFDTVAETFSDHSIDLIGPINEIVKVGDIWIGTTYDITPPPQGMGGFLGRVQVGQFFAPGKYFDLEGNLTLPADKELRIGDGSTGVIQAGSVGGQLVYGEELSGATFTPLNHITPDAGALKHKRVVAGVVHGTSAVFDVAWDTPFDDDSYTAIASILNTTAAAASLRVVHIEEKTAAKIVVRVENTSPGDDLVGILQVIAMHD